MHNDKFGDSYDYVKRVFLQTIAEPGAWFVHPMLFYYDGGGLDLDAYAGLLGLSPEAILSERDGNNRRRQRADLVEDAADSPHQYLFLDPDTGINRNLDARRTSEHVTVAELLEITCERPGKVVLVFDHAFRDGGDAVDKVRAKLDLFRGQDPPLYRAAVIVREHRCVCFVWLSTAKSEVQQVTDRLRQQLKIPAWRFVTAE